MKIVKLLLWVLVFAGVLVGVSEIYLARLGYTVDSALACQEYALFDPYLGWIIRPGRTLANDSANFHQGYETVWPDCCRASRPQRRKKSSKRVMLLGCSHTFGMGVPDEGTFAWKLNERFPDITFDNLGEPAYGTYQCYLREKQQLLMHPDYDLVLYCGVSDHLCRNTEYHVVVGQIDQPKNYALNPRVELDSQGDLLFYEPVRRWPGDGVFVCVNFAKRVYYSWLIDMAKPQRDSMTFEKQVVFWEINRLMAKQAESYGAKYGLVWLEDGYGGNDAMKGFAKMVTENPWNNPKYDNYPSIPVYGIDFPDQAGKEYHLDKDHSHFNEKMHELWATEISKVVKELLGV